MISFDVLPSSPANNVEDAGLGYPVLFSEFNHGDFPKGMAPANISNLILSQFGGTSLEPSTPLADSISIVISGRPYEEMRWFSTGRVIALVTDVLPLWDWAICQFVCHSVGRVVFLILRCDPIALGEVTASPLKASGLGSDKAGPELGNIKGHRTCPPESRSVSDPGCFSSAGSSYAHSIAAGRAV